MEVTELRKIYQIDKDRLHNHYKRIKNQFQNLSPIEIVAKFLVNRSIGNTTDDVLGLLNHFKDRIADDKEILDLAFEWIRAQKVRLEYKKYLIRAQYHDDINLAIDDCIVEFFLEHDKYLRKLCKEDVLEFEISALYETFFNPYDIETFDINNILERFRNKVPTIFKENHKIDTRIVTLRAGLSQIIKEDYERVLKDRKEEVKTKDLSRTPHFRPKKEEISEFNGTLLERMIKTFCFKKEQLGTKEIEDSVKNLLASYLKFGSFYNYEEFKEILIKSLAEFMNAGLTDNLKPSHPKGVLETLISKALEEFREIHQIKILDGLAWVNDLKPVLKKFVTKFVDELFKPKKAPFSPEIIEKEPPEKEKLKEEKPSDEIDFSVIFNIDLEVEEYRNKLEKLLETSKHTSIEKRNIIRMKVQEFKMEKRKNF